jgi:hypothetical protein
VAAADKALRLRVKPTTILPTMAEERLALYQTVINSVADHAYDGLVFSKGSEIIDTSTTYKWKPEYTADIEIMVISEDRDKWTGVRIFEDQRGGAPLYFVPMVMGAGSREPLSSPYHYVFESLEEGHFGKIVEFSVLRDKGLNCLVLRPKLIRAEKLYPNSASVVDKIFCNVFVDFSLERAAGMASGGFFTANNRHVTRRDSTRYCLSQFRRLAIEKYWKNYDTVLDLGIGRGNYWNSNGAKRAGKLLIGVDLSALEQAEFALGYKGGAVSVIESDLGSRALLDNVRAVHPGPIDFALSTYAAHFAFRSDECASNLLRTVGALLGPNGLFLIIDYCGEELLKMADGGDKVFHTSDGSEYVHFRNIHLREDGYGATVKTLFSAESWDEPLISDVKLRTLAVAHGFRVAADETVQAYAGQIEGSEVLGQFGEAIRLWCLIKA